MCVHNLSFSLFSEKIGRKFAEKSEKATLLISLNRPHAMATQSSDSKFADRVCNGASPCWHSIRNRSVNVSHQFAALFFPMILLVEILESPASPPLQELPSSFCQKSVENQIRQTAGIRSQKRFTPELA
jgi:hypothetical protein